MIRLAHQVTGYRLRVTVAPFEPSPTTCNLSPLATEGSELC